MWQVEEIALNNTVLKRTDGCRVWYPNSMMNVQPVLNVSRSDNRWEFFKVRELCHCLRSHLVPTFIGSLHVGCMSCTVHCMSDTFSSAARGHQLTLLRLIETD